MMRWMFAVLLLANIGVLMWASWYRDVPGESAQPRPVFHPELMVPLNSPGLALRARKNEHREQPLVVAKPRSRCVSLGPFTGDLADKAAVILAGDKIESTRREEERRSESSYWVHLAPFATRKEAESRKQELEHLGIRDLLIMQDAQGAIAISLGLYTKMENAQHRMQELAQLGITARQEVRYRTETLTWFDLRLPEPADEAIQALRSRDWGFPGIEVRDAVCPPEPNS